MEVIQERFMFMPKTTEFLNKPVKHMWLKILISSAAQTFKNV